MTSASHLTATLLKLTKPILLIPPNNNRISLFPFRHILFHITCHKLWMLTALSLKISLYHEINFTVVNRTNLDFSTDYGFTKSLKRPKRISRRSVRRNFSKPLPRQLHTQNEEVISRPLGIIISFRNHN